MSHIALPARIVRVSLVLGMTFVLAACAGGGGGGGGGGKAVLVSPNAPRITTAAPTTAVVGLPYTYAIGTAGAQPLTVAVRGLPSWLAFSAAMNTISGVPLAANVGPNGPITVTVSNGIRPDATQTFTILVTSGGTAPVFLSLAPTSATVGVNYSYRPQASGQPAPTITSQTLPGWLTLTRGVLSGTPAAQDVGAHPVTLIASNGIVPDDVQSFTILVTPAVAAAAQITSAAPGNAYVGQAYSYTIVATGNPAPVLSASGLPGWLALNGSVLSGTPAVANLGANGPITITASNGVGSPATQTLTITVSQAQAGVAPSFTSTPPTTAQEGIAYAYQISVTGTPMPTIAVDPSTLPSWLFVNYSGDLIAGVPGPGDIGQTGVIRVTASNGVPPDAVQQFQITVTPGPIVLFSLLTALGTENTWNAELVKPTLVTPVTLIRGPGISIPTSAVRHFGGVGWTGAVSPDANDYFSFTVAPAAGNVLALTAITLDEKRSGSGPREWSIRSSLDAFATDLAVFQVPDDTYERLGQTATLPAGFRNLAQAIEFRIYAYKAESPTSGSWRIANVAVAGP